MLHPHDSLDFASLQARYRSGALKPTQVVEGVLERIAVQGDRALWITLATREELLARAAELEQQNRVELPLYSLPFAVKDNIDLAGYPTTAACPAYAYTPAGSAPAVQRLLDAGAIPIGKTNLDQFATGLTGTRTPYGTCGNAFNAAYIPGGSSAGSAVAVAAGLVSFALGTDTAGSGRVPAAFNNIVGFKPSRGLVSNRGVVPACRSLDCVSVFALTVADTGAVLNAIKGFDPRDPFSRPLADAFQLDGDSSTPFRFGLPGARQLEFFGNAPARALFDRAVTRLQALGGEAVEIDFEPFLEAARLLYEGPWLAERYAALQEWIETQPQALHPVTRQVIQDGARFSALEAFQGYYRLKALRRQIAPLWNHIRTLLTPTAGTLYTRAEVEADPLRLNARLGYYTNFMNLLDLCAIAVPAGFLPDGLPFGVTLAAPAFKEARIYALADALHRASNVRLGATAHELPPWPREAKPAATEVRLAVCGAHLSGLPLNPQLTERGARLLRRCRTAPRYRLYALEAFDPPRPGLVRSEPGYAIEVEVWQVPVERFGGFVDAIPAPLAIGTVELEDGERVRGFLCEQYATATARDISTLGGWRAYLASL